MPQPTSQEILKRIDSILRASPNELERTGKDLTFTDVKQEIDQLFIIFDKLRSNIGYVDVIPFESRRNILEFLKKFDELVVGPILAFDAHIAEAGRKRDQIAELIRTLYRDIYNQLFLFVSVLELKGAKSEEILENSRQQLAAAGDQYKQKLHETDELLTTLREVAQDSGISKFSEVFRTQATKHLVLAVFGLIALIATGGLLAWEVYSLFTDLRATITDGTNLNQQLQLALAKLFLLSFFSIFVFQATKFFNAHQHLYVVNKHRENCLEVFKTLVQSTDDHQVKDTLLVQATKAIFDLGLTGLINAKDFSREYETNNFFDALGRSNDK